MLRSKRIFFVIVFLLAISLFLTNNVYAVYPDKPIKIIAPYNPGGPSDIACRTIAEHIQKYLPEPLAVVNIAGAGGVLGCQEVLNAKPDGYTLLLHHFAMQVAYHTGTADFDYDAFTPIARIGALDNAYFVNADSPWQTLDEFIEYAKDHPGEVKYGATIGATSHLNGVALEDYTGIDLDIIPVDGSALQIAAVLGNHIDMTCSELGQIVDFQKAGDFRILAIDTEQRNEKLAPEVPTLMEMGIDFALGQKHGIFAPKGVSEEVISILNSAFENLAKDEDFIADMFERAGIDVAYLPHEEYVKVLKNYSNTIGNLVEKAGLK